MQWLNFEFYRRISRWLGNKILYLKTTYLSANGMHMQSCGIILLAAGKSARMGQPKQLLKYKHKSLVRHSIHAAVKANAAPVILVTGANAADVEKEAQGLQIIVAENIDWPEGIASSIRCGLNALLETAPDIEGAVFMVCDQPFVTAALLNQLLFATIDKGKEIVACAYGATIGTPAVFGKSFFPLLLQLRGDEGAKKIMLQYPDALGTVSFPQGGIDIDTTEDYEGLKKL